MARTDVTQATVLESIMDRLRAALLMNDRQVYETISPNYLPRIPTGGDFYLAVSPAEGTFISGEQIPGNCTEDWGVSVTAYTRVKLDSTDHDEKLLLDASRGLLAIKRKILKALIGSDLETDGGNTFLRQLLFARSCSRPEMGESPKGKIPIGMITIEFGVSFDWDLTTP